MISRITLLLIPLLFPLCAQAQLYFHSGTAKLSSGEQLSGELRVSDKGGVQFREGGQVRDLTLNELSSVVFEDGTRYQVETVDDQNKVFAVSVSGPVSLLLDLKKKGAYLFLLTKEGLTRLPKLSFKLPLQEQLTGCEDVTDAYKMQDLRYRIEDVGQVIQAYNECASPDQPSQILPVSLLKSNVGFMVGASYVDINRDNTISRYFNSTYQQPGLGMMFGVQYDQKITQRFSLLHDVVFRRERVQIVDAPLVNGNILQGKLSLNKVQFGSMFNMKVMESLGWKIHLFSGVQFAQMWTANFTQEAEIIPPNTENNTIIASPDYSRGVGGLAVGLGIKKKTQNGKEMGIEMRFNHQLVLFGPQDEKIRHHLIDFLLVYSL